MQSNLTMWHGGGRWLSRPEIRAPREGRAECGPGLYFTNQYSTARSYAKGGKVVMRVELPAATDIRWLENVKLSKAEVIEFFARTPRLRNKAPILADITRLYAEDEWIPANVPLNLMVNYLSCVGRGALALLEFYLSKGIQASYYSKNAQEFWVVVFDVQIIKSWTKESADPQTFSQKQLTYADIRNIGDLNV